MEECKHIFSYEEGCDEAWLNYEPRNPKYMCQGIDIVFNFCPLCGEKLELKEIDDASTSP